MSEAYKDIGLGLFLLLAALVTHYWIIPVGIQSPGAVANPALAPAFWPRIIVIALAGVSLVVAAQGAAQMWRIRKGIEEPVPRAPDWLGTFKVIVALILLFVYYWTLTWGGIVVPSMAAVIVFTLLHGERRLHYFAPAAIVFPLALYYFFLKVAQVPMPLGIFEPLFP